MNRLRLASCALVSFALVSVAAAADRWETTFLNLTDDTSSTPNFLRHGTVQLQHDLEGNPDEDWMAIRVKDAHSYEARVTSDTVYWDPACGSPECPRFDRVSAAGAVLTAGTVTSDGVGGFDLGPGQGIVASGLSVRWISVADGKEFVRTRGDAAHIEISDTGPGIAAEDLPFIFDPYYSASKKHHKTGPGLGLYISKGIVDAHGGEIRCGSAPGVGTTFSITLPLKVAQPQVQAAS